MINEIAKNSKMNLTDDMLKLMEHIDEIKKEFKDVLNKYSKEFSETDKKQQDILHYIEFKKVSSVGAYRLLKELNKVRQQRRRAEGLGLYDCMILKSDTRPFLEKELEKLNQITTITNIILSLLYVYYSWIEEEE